MNTRKSATIASYALVLVMVLGAVVQSAYADKIKASAEGDAITASLNQEAVDKIDQARVAAGTLIKAPAIEFRCKGGIATKCSDRAMNAVAAKIVEVQNLVINCQRGVESVSSVNLSTQVRSIVNSLPANIKLFVIPTTSDRGNRRSQRKAIDGFCDLNPADLVRTSF